MMHMREVVGSSSGAVKMDVKMRHFERKVENNAKLAKYFKCTIGK